MRMYVHMWPGTGVPCHPCPLPLYMSRGVETSQDLYLAASEVHGTGVYAAKRLQRDHIYCPEVVENQKACELYHFMDCLTLFPQRTGYRFKFQAIVVLLETDMDKETLQRGLAVVPRGYVSYLNHTERENANAKIGIRIDGLVTDFLPWAQRDCPQVLESLAWDMPGRDCEPLCKRLVGFPGLFALRSLLTNSDPKIELVIIPIKDIEAGQELLIFYGTHDVTQYQNLQSIDTRNDAHLRLIRELCVCHRDTVLCEDDLLKKHMTRLEKAKPTAVKLRQSPAKSPVKQPSSPCLC